MKTTKESLLSRLGRRSRKVCENGGLALGFYLLILFSPFWVLLSFGEMESVFKPGESSPVFSLAYSNTFWLGLGVLAFTTPLGLWFAYCHCFFQYPFKKTLHRLLFMPMAFPAYVMAFIYLGLFGSSTGWSQWLTLQGELGFLILVLSMALTPYIYYFSVLGFKTLSQNQWEAARLLGGGAFKFMTHHWGLKVSPFLVSGQLLVLFESLSDFGAAHVINVPVMTTLIYKQWFDLFSFQGAVNLALKYSLIILLLLMVEAFFKCRQGALPVTSLKNPIRGEPWGVWRQGVFILFPMLSYIGLAFVLPSSQIILWTFQGTAWPLWQETLITARNSLLMALGAGLMVGLLSFIITGNLKSRGLNSHGWVMGSTVSYAVPGSLLAVAVYALLWKGLGPVGESWALMALCMALAYKFLTVGMRPMAHSFEELPRSLFETSALLGVGFWRKWKEFLGPYLKETMGLVLLLVMMEVIKEMPLSLMLAPGDFQTLSIQIFNFTSEGEWEKAALPSLLLLGVGVTWVLWMPLGRKEG